MEIKTKKFHSNSSNYLQNITIELPKFCPRCGVSNNPSTEYLGISSNLAYFKHYCTDCSRNHFCFNLVNDKIGKMVALYPNSQPSNLPKLVCDFSPRFEKIYHDADLSEFNNALDLAGVGYRVSLEILLKDFALANELDSYEEIAKKTLNNAISQYFKSDIDLQTSADVVRILGNDYAHWDQHEGYDIETLKSYLQIFIQIINTKLMLKNPPVSRKKS